MSLFQTIVMLLFNDREEMSLEDIRTYTNIGTASLTPGRVRGAHPSPEPRPCGDACEQRTRSSDERCNHWRAEKCAF